MPDWKLWHAMAEESMTAGRSLQDECPRSAVSRFYYGAFQSATAYLLYLRLQPPEEREAWSHADTPDLLRDRLSVTVRSAGVRRDIQHRLKQLYKMRCDADYVGDQEISRANVLTCRKDAGYIVKIIDSVLPER